MPVGALLAALLGASSIAAADDFTAQQRKNIYDTIVKDQSSPSRAPGFIASTGSTLPDSVQLNEFPSAIDDPAVRKYQYALTGKQVVVADPKSRKIISVIGQ
jgi:hypothetical protein